jgi:cell wall-associated NlpC family hydrolase
MPPVNDVVRLITQYARQYGVDPRAALAVAMSEGGLGRGAVGDQGTSYGPFQLHVGGALPQGRGADWANSPAGLQYAVRQMANAGARGLTGRQAVGSIVQNFERPAAPGAEISRAMGYYGNTPDVGAMTPSDSPVATPPVDSRRALARATLGAVSSGNYQGLLDAAVRFRDKTGSLQMPTKKNGSQYVNSDPLVSRALAFAHNQVGRPYVWGGESRKEGGFDCSGLIDAAYRAAGIDFPGRLTTKSALRLGQKVSDKNLQPGDVIVTRGGNHMVMYVGGGKVIAARSSHLPLKQQIMYQPMSEIRAQGIVGIRRIKGAGRRISGPS